MSQRTFFTLRYGLPGYTFILMAILVAFHELKGVFFQPNSVQSTVIGAFLAFLSLLSGGAIGFLVSELWYVVFTYVLMGNYGKFSKLRLSLRDKYGLTEDRHHQILFMDYILRQSSNEMQMYTQRRFDLLHICCSTFVAIPIGLLFGLMIRLGWFTMNTSLDTAIASLLRSPLVMPDAYIHAVYMHLARMTTYDLGVVLIAAFLMILLFMSAWRVGKEHAMANKIAIMEVVNRNAFPKWLATDVFGEDYFRDSPVNTAKQETSKE